MISRGYFIGDVIDSLSSISERVEFRSKFGLTDLNRYLEDFFKEILNRVMTLSLVNQNETRSNAPGLDLIDKANDIGFQITPQKTSAKVNEALERVLSIDDRHKGFGCS